MAVSSEGLEKMIASVLSDEDMKTEDIPNLDLYMDQIITLFDEKIHREGVADSRALTKTMINNYSKDGLIKPIRGKKYTREQILQMLVIYHLKQTLSIGEIKLFMQSLYGEGGYENKEREEELRRIYDTYLAQKESSRAQTQQLVMQMAQQIGSLPEPEARSVLILELCNLSCTLKRIASGLCSPQE